MKTTLSTNTVIYIADVSPLQAPELFERLLSGAPEYRRKKAKGYRFAKDRCLSLGAGLLLKKALADFHIFEDTTEYGERGKPYLRNVGGVHYSLSHSGTMAMCAVSNGEIGCDIEEIDPKHLRVAVRALSAEEKAVFYSLPDETAQTDMLFRLWVLKESYMKLTGEGLSLDPCSLSVSLDPAPQLAGAEDCRFFELTSPKGYKAACCTRGSIIPPAPVILNLAEW